MKLGLYRKDLKARRPERMAARAEYDLSPQCSNFICGNCPLNYLTCKCRCHILDTFERDW